MTNENTRPEPALNEPAHGFNRMTPYFTVADPEALIAFMIAVFDAELLKKDVYDDGRVQHARLKVEGALMMLNQAGDDYPAQSSQMHLFVDDLMACYEKGLALGAVSIMTPNRRPHGEMMAGLIDPCGNRWWIASGG